MEISPKYVVFDGMDGSGKGTQIDFLKEELGDRVVFTREPGGTPFAEEIRKLVRDNPLAAQSTPLNNFLLFWAAREEVIHNLVMPTLSAGKHVFSDRGDSSTFAFQAYGEQRADLLGAFDPTRRLVFADKKRRAPDLYIVFDLPAEVARERVMRADRSELNHFDVRDVDYYQRVRAGFRFFAQHYSTVKIIDATKTPERVHREVQMILAAEMVIPEYAFIV